MVSIMGNTKKRKKIHKKKIRKIYRIQKHLESGRFFCLKVYSNCTFPIDCESFFISTFVSNFLNTILPTNPAKHPPAIANANAPSTLSGELNANGARSPGIGEAVPGALLMIPNAAAAIPANPPPKKLDP